MASKSDEIFPPGLKYLFSKINKKPPVENRTLETAATKRTSSANKSMKKEITKTTRMSNSLHNFYHNNFFH